MTLRDPELRTFGPLLILAGLNVALAIGCALALRIDVPLVGGVHPAVKPLKFAVSVALLVASVAFVLRALDASTLVRDAIGATLGLTMTVEMFAIVTQAVRGRASHFNIATKLDATLWYTMGSAIAVALLAMIALAILASIRPLALDPLVSFAVRAGLWLLLLVAVSGFAMGGRYSHSVAPGGDLRVPHFFAIHALQALPACAFALRWLPLASGPRWSAMVLVTLLWTAIAVGTLVQAFQGQAAWVRTS